MRSRSVEQPGTGFWFACIKYHHFESQHVSALSKMLRGRIGMKSWREPAAAKIQGLGNAADVKLLWEGMAGVTTQALLVFFGEKNKRSNFCCTESNKRRTFSQSGGIILIKV